MVQVVLRGIPKASACSSSVWSPISLAASASCLIFADCRALISDGHISCICPSFSICRWKRRSRSFGLVFGRLPPRQGFVTPRKLFFHSCHDGVCPLLGGG